MAGKVLNIKFCIPLKLYHGLTGKCQVVCHYSYNLSLPVILKIELIYENDEIQD